MRLVENEVRISVRDVVTVVGRRGPHEVLLVGTPVRVVLDNQIRAWLECPRCLHRRRRLYLDDQVGCRVCLGLGHARRNGPVRRMPVVGRIARLRLQIGADPRPGSPIVRRRAAASAFIVLSGRSTRQRPPWSGSSAS